MKTKILIVALTALFVSVGSQSVRAETEHKHKVNDHGEDLFWQEEYDEVYHGHEGLHGGQFGDASDLYHYEVLLDDEGILRLYMYDEEAQPMKDITKIEARWTINPDAEYPLKGDFQLAENKEYLFVKLPSLKGNYLQVKIEALKEGKWLPVEFLLSLSK